MPEGLGPSPEEMGVEPGQMGEQTESKTEADFSEKFLGSLRSQEETRMAGLAVQKEQIRSLYPGFGDFVERIIDDKSDDIWEQGTKFADRIKDSKMRSEARDKRMAEYGKAVDEAQAIILQAFETGRSDVPLDVLREKGVNPDDVMTALHYRLHQKDSRNPDRWPFKMKPEYSAHYPGGGKKVDLISVRYPEPYNRKRPGQV